MVTEVQCLGSAVQAGFYQLTGTCDSFESPRSLLDIFLLFFGPSIPSDLYVGDIISCRLIAKNQP